MSAEGTRSLVRALALALREEALPLLGSEAGRRRGEQRAAGGDLTFEIDSRAERVLESYLRRHAPHVAFYSEDRGLVDAPGGPAREVLVVDPVDGTRPAMAGLESCCVSIAAAPLHEHVTMGEVTVGCVVEIRSGAVYLAERGVGLVEGPRGRLSSNESVKRMFWSYGLRGRPARALVEVIGELIDTSSVAGASFELGSASFDMTRVLTGQLDCYVEPGPRLISELPELEGAFRDIGGGEVLNNSPYDLAAAALCLDEAGAIVTDARGAPLAERPLLGSGVEFQMSCVASANPALHEQVLAALDDGLERLRRSLSSADRGGVDGPPAR